MSFSTWRTLRNRCHICGVLVERGNECEKCIEGIEKFMYEEKLHKELKAAEEKIQNITEKSKKFESVAELWGGAIDQFRKVFMELESETAKRLEIEKVPTSLNDWRDAAFGNSKSKGWHDTNSDDFVTKLALIHSEVSEALEEYRNNKGINEIYYEEGKEKPEGIPVELADILIRVFDLCGKYNIDIEAAVRLKHEYNKTRPHRHGGKKI